MTAPGSVRDVLLEGAFKFPGFGLPLNFTPRVEDGNERDLFRNALNGRDLTDGLAQLPLTTLREFTMLQFMNQLTDKPNWHEKVFDETITSKWKKEALSKQNSTDIIEKMIDWCIAELQYKAKIFANVGAVSVYNGDVVKSDIAIPESLKESLKAAAASLEQMPAREKDWHPGSDGKVLDLVHPSLFPLVYGRSRILPGNVIGLDDCISRSGEGVTIAIPPEEETVVHIQKMNRYHQRRFMTPFSRRFQWLPCDVDLSGGEGSVRITSYINNLHPERHKDLYGVIEQIIARTIPLWNMTLTPLKYADFRYRRIKYKFCDYDPNPEGWSDSEGPQREEDEDEIDYYERREEWYRETREVVRPEPGPFTPPPAGNRSLAKSDDPEDVKTENAVDIWRDYADQGIQVIVKLANIHLTPEKPEYGGGSWHVEGQLNEHICASAVYYYDNHNITTSRLAFRQQSSTNVLHIIYPQEHHDWLEDIFGCEQDGPGIQDVGTVDTPEGRLLTWPNILQHQVQPFELADPSRPGHRKIIALFLVDPNIRIISTANVPPQQRDWWSDEIRKGDSPVARLPVELQDHVLGAVEEFPISLDEAKDLRLKLMDERRVFVHMHDEAFRQHEFSLCEH